VDANTFVHFQWCRYDITAPAFSGCEGFGPIPNVAMGAGAAAMQIERHHFCLLQFRRLGGLGAAVMHLGIHRPCLLRFQGCGGTRAALMHLANHRSCLVAVWVFAFV
jgi:hypothetical protein